MPVATAAANGLMSAEDKKTGITAYPIKSQINPCFKIPGKLWRRNCGLALLSMNGGIQFVCFSSFKRSSQVSSHVYNVCGTENYMRFYHDSESFYININCNGSYDSTLYVLSSSGSEYIGDDVIDDTYTEVSIE